MRQDNPIHDGDPTNDEEESYMDYVTFVGENNLGKSHPLTWRIYETLASLITDFYQRQPNVPRLNDAFVTLLVNKPGAPVFQGRQIDLGAAFGIYEGKEGHTVIHEDRSVSIDPQSTPALIVSIHPVEIKEGDAANQVTLLCTLIDAREENDGSMMLVHSVVDTTLEGMDKPLSLSPTLMDYITTAVQRYNEPADWQLKGKNITVYYF